MPVFELTEVAAAREQAQRPYLEFLRVPSMSLGLYVLAAGGTDRQQPHTEDEAYYVLSGRGQVRVGTEDRVVGPGTVVFVPANVPHHFHTITEELRLLVFFAPAEGTAARAP